MQEFYIPGSDMPTARNEVHTMNRVAPGDRRTFPTFSIEPVELPSESAAQGRPIYRDVEMVSIRIAGDSKTEVVRKVSDHMRRNEYRAEYEYWKRTQQQAVTGTPLEQWPGASVSFIKTCKNVNVFSVEALAELGDSHLSNLGMDARTMQARAKAWLASAKDNAEAERLAAQNNALQDQIAMLQEQIKEMGARFSEIQNESPRKGR
jgi:hypothetical protein